MPSELVINSMMSNCQEEMNKIKERFDAYITRFNDKFFTDDAEKIKYLSKKAMELLDVLKS